MNQLARAAFQNNNLLRYLDNAGLDRVAALAVRRCFEQGATIFAEGETPAAIYGVISGQVQMSARTCTDEEIILQAYGSGQIFGEVACIDGLPRFGRARAATKVEVFVISREHFLRLIAQDPLLSVGLMAVFCQRFRISTRVIVGEYAQRNIEARLAHRVLELATERSNGRDCHEHSLEITQAELAKFVFVSRQVVNQYLCEWQHRGWVSTSHRRLLLTDCQALAMVASSGRPTV